MRCSLSVVEWARVHSRVRREKRPALILAIVTRGLGLKISALLVSLVIFEIRVCLIVPRSRENISA